MCTYFSIVKRYKVNILLLLLVNLTFLVFPYKELHSQQSTANKYVLARTEKSIGLITGYRRPSKHSSGYTAFYIEDISANIHYGKCIVGKAYSQGDKLMISYDPHNISNAIPLLDEPYFSKRQLSDTTEGTIKLGKNHCMLYYETFPQSDSFDVNILSKMRYLSKKMIDSLKIKDGATYKVVYNKRITSPTNAEILFTEVIDSADDESKYKLFIALKKIQSNRNTLDAVKILTSLIKTEPTNAYYYFQRAIAEENIHETEKAIDDYSKYIQLRPEDKRGYVRRAILYIKKNRFNEAEKDITTLFYLSGQDSEAYYLQGVIYFHKHQYNSAVEAYTTAISMANGKNLKAYYYDRAVARTKQLKKETPESIDDYEKSKRIPRAHKVDELKGEQPHPQELHYNRHSIYMAIASDYTLNSFSALNSNMTGILYVPYTANSSSGTKQLPFTINTKQRHSYSALGGSFEIGKFKRTYAKIEINGTINDKPSYTGLRLAIGRNIKPGIQDVFILRPELGISYLNRSMNVGQLTPDGASQISIMNTTFKSDTVTISFRENAFNFSPSLGIWIFPYLSRVTLRVSVGYNLNLSNRYSFYYYGDETHLRVRSEKANASFSNTNGQNNNFFNYQGFFSSVGLGIRF